MPGQYNFKSEWEKTRNQLVKFSKEAAKVAKKGEAELIKFSRQSKLHLDATANSLRKEKLYYLIGKEYAHAPDPFQATPKLTKFLSELKKVNEAQSVLKRKLNTKKRVKK